MAYALVWQISLDKTFDLLEQSEHLLNDCVGETLNVILQKQASINYIKSLYYFFKNDSDQAIKHAEQSLKVREELGTKHEIAESLTALGLIYHLLKYEYDIAKTYLERSQKLAKESNQKHIVAYNFMLFGMILALKGKAELSLIKFEQSLTMSEELNNKRQISMLYNNIAEAYRLKGELEQALVYLEKALPIAEEIENKWNIGTILSSMTMLFIEKKDQDNAQKYLELLKQFNEQHGFKVSETFARLSEALILKMSTRTRNRAKAEELLKQIVEEEIVLGETTVLALINLCDLFLGELRITNDIEVIDEIKPLIKKLLNIAEITNSHWLLTETYLLQSKLSLITLDIKEAQRFLTQAKQITKRFGLNQLDMKIANEHDDLLKKLDLWEKLKEVDAPMSERIELARMDEQIGDMFQKRSILAAHVSEEKVAIHKEKKVCLVCRGEVLRYTYICECGAIYCENCARAITDIENVCWVCDVPIDYLKPTKPYQEEERVKFDKTGKKPSNKRHSTEMKKN
ncbi:MAG: tetratricopeptide repeat protein [Candidatus Lokiarchaeota archaeon]|nr:tetratricopeptide repeat protein [Candidatus Lokiarchaeota archaeon]